MKLSVKLLTLALVAVPAVPAIAAVTAAPAPTTVARYTFDGGNVAGRVASNSTRSGPLRIRGVNGGTVRFFPKSGGGRYIGFPPRCTTATTACPRALLEAADDADLDPGTRNFRWGASVYVKKYQLRGSANVMQKGVVSTESQWKLQIGANLGKAHCVVVGRGSAVTYLVRSSVDVADGRWHRVMCLRTSTQLTVFVDGMRRGSVAVPASLSISNNLPVRIGGPNFSPSSDMYHGFLDDAYAALG
ncbi:MAG TPA: LamG-like jellyroll fold domain-containing protein [Actinoplanes sp.]|nr:LamG-like jellyroll fold domain-containing protein [Actinoplanes sp.]